MRQKSFPDNVVQMISADIKTDVKQEVKELLLITKQMKSIIPKLLKTLNLNQF